MARVFRPGKAVFRITRERSFLLCQFLHGFSHGICREQERSATAVYFHMASYITHFKILHRGSLPYPFFADFWNVFGSMAVLSHSSGPINRIFKAFFRTKTALFLQPNRAVSYILLYGVTQLSFLNGLLHIPECVFLRAAQHGSYRSHTG